MDDGAFFIGWSNNLGRRLSRFLTGAAVVFLLAAAGLGAGIGASLDDPSGSLFKLGERQADGSPARSAGWGEEQILRGYITTLGYALFHLPPDNEHPRGRVLLLAGDGKYAAPAGNGPSEVRGMLLRRGSVEMLVAADRPRSIEQADPRLVPAVQEPLGHWRISGEICDGKCFTGAMAPGTGLAHRACADLCLIGGLPAVLQTAEPVAGSSTILLASLDGGPPPAEILKYVAVPIEVEGALERLGNVLVLRIDPARMHLL